MERFKILYEALCAAVADGWCVLDADGAVEHCNDAFASIGGLDAEAAVGVDFVQLLVAHRLSLREVPGGRPLETVQSIASQAALVLESVDNDTQYPVTVRSLPHGGWAVHLQAVGEGRRASHWECSVDYLRAALDVVDVGVLICGPDGRTVYYNGTASEMLGSALTMGANVGKLEFVHRTNNELLMPHVLAEVLVEGEPAALTHNVAFLSGGEERAIELSAVPLLDGGAVVGAAVAFRDVTGLRRTEDELRRAQHIESVATLAGGIAHDFNNVLTAVLGNITLAKVGLVNDDDQRTALDEAEEAAVEAKGLTQQLLVFSHGGVPVRSAASIAETVSDSAGFVVRGSNVKCSVSAPEKPWPVQVERDQLSQLIQNLVLNAKEAMPEGGIVTISVENRHVSKQQNELPAGRYVCISVQDEGFGIPRKNLSRVFEPYFTTKPNGSGLGLAVAYSIVKNHDGYFQLSSEPGSGTTAAIYFPTLEPSEAKTPENQDVELFLGKKVLVMDDEALIRSVLSKMLRRLGCRSSSAQNGNEAVYLYQRAFDSGRPFDLVILDLTVPGGMGGKDAMVRIREADPSARVVVSSGYSNDPVMADHQRFGFDGVISKPYSLADLSAALGAVFSTPRED